MSGTMIGWVLLAMLVLAFVLFILARTIVLGASDRAGRGRGCAVAGGADRASDFAHFPWLLWWPNSPPFARGSNEASGPRSDSGREHSSWRDSDHSSPHAGGHGAPHADGQSHSGALAPDLFSLNSGFGTHETAGGAAGFENGFDAGGGAGGSFDSGGGGLDAGGCDTGSS